MKKEVKAIILGSLLTLIISLSMFTESKMSSNIVTNSNNELSNKKIGWGIQRKNSHEQPDLGAKNTELINKYSGMALGNKDKKYIYLTFDLGYEAGYTAKILDSLNDQELDVYSKEIFDACNIMKNYANDNKLLFYLDRCLNYYT